MKYTVQNGIHILELAVSEFKIVMYDKTKKSIGEKTYVNAGFFGGYKESGSYFTLPVGHVVCDFKATNAYTKKYCQERGTLAGTKLTYDGTKLVYNNQFYGKTLSTLIVSGSKVSIQDVKTLPPCTYAITGVPVMRNGADVTFATYVRNQGWDASTLYATWHTFVGLKGDGKIYVMGMKTTTGNMITSAEAYKKFKLFGFKDVIKLDGGGSFIMQVDGKPVVSTLENRQINTVIVADVKADTAYPKPTRTLSHGCSGADVRWLQDKLNNNNFNLQVDGAFGNATYTAVKAYQQAKNLVVDGIAGSKTIAALEK